jgi:hypothetical protein
MRTITTKQTVPAEEVSTTTYGCDNCDFTADDPDDVATHYGREHTRKGEMEVGGETLYKFEAEADAKAWLDAEDSDARQYRERSVRWSGAGWYAIETYTKPCPRGCCTDHCVRLYPAEHLVWEGTRRARAIMQQVTAIRRALREDGHGC